MKIASLRPKFGNSAHPLDNEPNQLERNFAPPFTPWASDIFLGRAAHASAFRFTRPLTKFDKGMEIVLLAHELYDSDSLIGLRLSMIRI